MASRKKKNQNHLIIISVVILLIVTVGVFFCIKAYVDKQKNRSILITNTVTMNYTDDYNGIVVPATSIANDIDGKLLNTKENVFDFVISSNIKNNTKTKYTIYLKKENDSNIPSDMVKVYLQSSLDNEFKNAKEEIIPTAYNKKVKNEKKGMLLKSGALSKNTKVYYRLKVWIDQSYVAQNPNDYFKATVNINAE